MKLLERGQARVLDAASGGARDVTQQYEIVARAEFVRRLGKLGAEFGVPLPKGASPAVEIAAKSFVRKHGQEALVKVAKLHFKTTQAVLKET